VTAPRVGGDDAADRRAAFAISYARQSPRFFTLCARRSLAGVFQINSVTRSNGLRRTHNTWQITSPGFRGRNTTSTLRVYAVRGTAADVVPPGGLDPVSNVATERVHIGN
jgi:hypothetical protein